LTPGDASADFEDEVEVFFDFFILDRRTSKIQASKIQSSTI
jgi:hypothetical protein